MGVGVKVWGLEEGQEDVDSLTGGSGRDWFFVGEGDVITDLDLDDGDQLSES